MGKRGVSVQASMGALFALLVSIAIFGIVLYSQTDTVHETVDVGFEGIKKAEEVKQQLETQSQEQF